MLSLVELFEICNNRRDYTTVTPKNKKYEVDYKFLEDAEARTLYIFFEPSDGKIDWKVNFSYWRKPYRDMEVSYRVHGGFLESWKLIRDAIRAKVRELDEGAECKEDGHWNFKWRKVVVVGYSHGGALAALCHECVWFERPDLRDSSESLRGYSFDGPRVFAGLWIPKKLKERWRDFRVFRNHGDMVTHLPPVIFGFRHVGTKVRIGKGKNPGLIKAHYPQEIVESLKEYMEEGAQSTVESAVEVLDNVGDVVETVKDRIEDPKGTCEILKDIVKKIKED